MNTTLRTRIVLAVSTLSLLAAGAGCAGTTLGGADEGPAPGHGTASRSYALDSGDHSNPFDTTDDPSDPAFVPQPKPLKPWAGGDVGKTAAALSTTTGTTFQLTYYDVSLRP